jgi:methylated-DNA-[protein]-cysteine S-methyltransferase
MHTEHSMPDTLVYRSICSPLGELFLASTREGLCRVSWYTSQEAFAAELEECFDQEPQWDGPEAEVTASRPRMQGPSAILADAARQLAGYFDGQRRQFELPLDLSRQRPFQRRVLTVLLQVPYGETVSYSELAALAGYPGAARAVGGVMRHNPLPIIVPCHRVLLSSGELGGFGGRPDLKRRLLDLEGWKEDRRGVQRRLENLFE